MLPEYRKAILLTLVLLALFGMLLVPVVLGYAVRPYGLAAQRSTFLPIIIGTNQASPTSEIVPKRLYGLLQPKQQYYKSDWDAGIRILTLELGWNLYEPQEGAWNTTYIREKQAEYQQMVDVGFQVILDVGMQYPPAWILDYPNSHFVNQYGDAFNANLGVNGVNAVFNQTIRDQQERYVRHIFDDLGTNFYAVRLGWGFYGELNYPMPTYKGNTNSYWAYDDIAQGRAAGLPAGMQASPVPGWIPGQPSTDHAASRAFLEWYLESLKNYHDWQIRTVRSVYHGKLMMLYPSWGIRPGQADAAIAVNLNGTTSAEINGEIQKGLDFARFIIDVSDPNVVVYTTWLDAPDTGDGSANPTNWSPVHYMSSLAAANPLQLRIWGENSGHNNLEEMEHCFQQMQIYNLDGMLWAFEADLYSGQYASFDQYAQFIVQYR